jgi:hypothetical protein
VTHSLETLDGIYSLFFQKPTDFERIQRRESRKHIESPLSSKLEYRGPFAAVNFASNINRRIENYLDDIVFVKLDNPPNYQELFPEENNWENPPTYNEFLAETGSSLIKIKNHRKFWFRCKTFLQQLFFRYPLIISTSRPYRV